MPPKRRRTTRAGKADAADQVDPATDLTNLEITPQVLAAITQAVKSVINSSHAAAEKRSKDLQEALEVSEQSRKTLLNTVQETLKCVICHCVMQYPQLSICCRSLLGCGACLERPEMQSCPKCRSPLMKHSLIDVAGLDPLLHLIGDADM